MFGKSKEQNIIMETELEREPVWKIEAVINGFNGIERISLLQSDNEKEVRTTFQALVDKKIAFNNDDKKQITVVTDLNKSEVIQLTLRKVR